MCRIYKISRHRQLDDKSCTARIVSFGANLPAMFEYRSLHNRKPEAGAAIASRKIRLKQSTKISRVDSPPRVCDFGAQQTSFGIQRGHNLDLLLACHLRQCVARIVNQVNKHAFDLFDVEHRGRKLKIQFEEHRDAIKPFFVESGSLRYNIIETRKLE